MALITASDIATTVFNNSEMDTLFQSSVIEAVEKRRIIDVITEDAYDAIVAAMGTGETYEAEGALLETALCYYVAAENIIAIATRPENRGVFNLNAEVAQRVEADGLHALKVHYMFVANQHMAECFELIEAWTDYNDYDFEYEAADFKSDIGGIDITNLKQAFKI